MSGLSSITSRMLVRREKSNSTKKLVAALCRARLRFSPVQLDMVGVDDFGKNYRYASLHSIMQATDRPLAEEGIYLHTCYICEQGVLFASVTVEKDDEHITSTVEIPPCNTLRKRKAAMSLFRRAAIEGLLNLSAETDTDGFAAPVDQPTDKQATNLANAKLKLSEANSRDEVANLLDKAAAYVSKGDMPADCMTELRDIGEQRLENISVEAQEALNA